MNLFHRSPSLHLFEEVYTPEFRDIGHCIGYCLEDGMVIYAITLKEKIVYLTDMEFKSMGCRATVSDRPFVELPSFSLYEQVSLVGVEGQYEIIGFELTTANVWMYTVRYGETSQLMSPHELLKVVSV